MGLLRRLLGKGDSGSESQPRGISKQDALAAYVIREHKQGRSLEEILEDPYLRNRASEEQRLRILERPDVIHAVGENTAAMAKERVRES